jgi:hypothetical protein
MERTSGPRQAGISEQDCASSKLKLIVVQQVKAVDRPSVRLRHRSPFEGTEFDGKDPTEPCRTQGRLRVMGDDSQSFFADDGNWFCIML